MLPVPCNGPPIITLGKTAEDSYAVSPDAVLSNEQYAGYQVGNLHVYVHSAKYLNGELRGQLQSTNVENNSKRHAK